ncbi:MAG: hypothetical protein AB7F86_06355 [Bdellovibrionales bacterium]
MFLILLAHSTFGFMFAIRIFRKFRGRNLISANRLACFVILSGLFTTLGVWMCKKSLFSISIVTLLSAAILLIGLRQIEAFEIRKLQSHVLPFLDSWILNLRIGMAAKSARDAALNEQPEFFQRLVRPLFEVTDRRLDRHPFLPKALLREVHLLHQKPHHVVDRLFSLRQSLAAATTFRRKSGQALRQAHLQCGVLVLLHLGLVLFSVGRTGLLKNFDLILWSTALNFAGLAVLRLMARRTKWTI